MDCMSGDMPHWCATNTATSKEIWVEPVNRFLGAAAIYANDGKTIEATDEPVSEAVIKTEASPATDGSVNLRVLVTGTGRHVVGVRVFNATTNHDSQQFELTGNSTAETIFKLNVNDRNKPWIAVVTIDNDPLTRKEITGSFVEASFGK
jgi:hypothetical protein